MIKKRTNKGKATRRNSLVDNTPSTFSSSNTLSKKVFNKLHMTYDMWHMTRDIRKQSLKMLWQFSRTALAHLGLFNSHKVQENSQKMKWTGRLQPKSIREPSRKK